MDSMSLKIYLWHLIVIIVIIWFILSSIDSIDNEHYPFNMNSWSDDSDYTPYSNSFKVNSIYDDIFIDE